MIATFDLKHLIECKDKVYYIIPRKSIDFSAYIKPDPNKITIIVRKDSIKIKD